ncbi:hypothetical protein B0H12DRAFT_1076367 [Mycena haematopus]|nr:hypothetical protein B0H12DRAFT_1076367 [Mycena haematopus]
MTHKRQLWSLFPLLAPDGQGPRASHLGSWGAVDAGRGAQGGGSWERVMSKVQRVTAAADTMEAGVVRNGSSLLRMPLMELHVMLVLSGGSWFGMGRRRGRRSSKGRVREGKGRGRIWTRWTRCTSRRAWPRREARDLSRARSEGSNYAMEKGCSGPTERGVAHQERGPGVEGLSELSRRSEVVGAGRQVVVQVVSGEVPRRSSRARIERQRMRGEMNSGGSTASHIPAVASRESSLTKAPRISRNDIACCVKYLRRKRGRQATTRVVSGCARGASVDGSSPETIVAGGRRGKQLCEGEWTLRIMADEGNALSRNDSCEVQRSVEGEARRAGEWVIDRACIAFGVVGRHADGGGMRRSREVRVGFLKERLAQRVDMDQSGQEQAEKCTDESRQKKAEKRTGTDKETTMRVEIIAFRMNYRVGSDVAFRPSAYTVRGPILMRTDWVEKRLPTQITMRTFARKKTAQSDPTR